MDNVKEILRIALKKAYLAGVKGDNNFSEAIISEDLISKLFEPPDDEKLREIIRNFLTSQIKKNISVGVSVNEDWVKGLAEAIGDRVGQERGRLFTEYKEFLNREGNYPTTFESLSFLEDLLKTDKEG